MEQKKSIKHLDRKIGSPVMTGGVTSILSAFFGKILMDLGVTTSGINRLMEAHLNNAKNGVPQNLKERASARGNLWKDLTKPTMTWKIFCRGLRFLNIPKFDIQVTLHHVKTAPTVHSLTVNLDDPTVSLFEVADDKEEVENEQSK